ncbi:MAG: 5'-nucleotidase, lipoprotein e(P4) family [Bacteroidales bacterium]|nr:5'-nucleotidase, lipoprotein e(P4) family [Bacteroidales bacterium]
MKKVLIFILVLPVIVGSAQNPGSNHHLGQCNPKTMPVLWQQTAAEYRALCYQAFNLATLRINAIPAKEIKKGNLAIVTDLDETIFDNSFNEAQLILDHQSYSDSNWKAWTRLHAAPALPGAVEFLKATHARGISIFYISNRDTSEIKCTLENLKALSLPCADTAHLLLMSDASTKGPRRNRVMRYYRIVMLLGDNLNDFASCFERKSVTERSSEADKLKEEWGDKFIVLPNSTYGDWENALYNYHKDFSAEAKDSIRTTLLKGYK